VTEWGRVAPYIRFRYERTLERLPESGVVYEFGCGIGVGLAYLARRRPDLTFVGGEMSPEAVAYGNEHFSDLPNLELRVSKGIASFAEMMPAGAFLVALEVIEHLDDPTLAEFREKILSKVGSCAFSFPFREQNIEGTEHLQSFDLYRINEMFPGFEVLFIRRHSLKFIGFWERDRSPAPATVLKGLPEDEGARRGRALECLPEEGTVFEYGCGDGVGLAAMAEARPDLSFVGIDTRKKLFGRRSKNPLPNLRVERVDDPASIVQWMPRSGAYLQTFDYLEMLGKKQMETFRVDVMSRVDGAFFSLPYDRGAPPKGSYWHPLDLWELYALFPGFRVLDLSRDTRQIAGSWSREPRLWVREWLGVAGEGKAILAIGNTEGPALTRG